MTGLALAVALTVGCAAKPPEPKASLLLSPVLRDWIFATPEGNAYTSENAKGRVTVLLFLTTYDTASQIAVCRLNSEIHRLKRRINAIGVVLEPPNHSLLVGVFRDSLHLTLPLLLPDPATLAGQGPFGAIDVVPTWVILDVYGKEVWRKTGVNAIADLLLMVARLGASAEE
jgi:hypothetical protein